MRILRNDAGKNIDAQSGAYAMFVEQRRGNGDVAAIVQAETGRRLLVVVDEAGKHGGQFAHDVVTILTDDFDEAPGAAVPLQTWLLDKFSAVASEGEGGQAALAVVAECDEGVAAMTVGDGRVLIQAGDQTHVSMDLVKSVHEGLPDIDTFFLRMTQSYKPPAASVSEMGNALRTVWGQLSDWEKAELVKMLHGSNIPSSIVSKDEGLGHFSPWPSRTLSSDSLHWPEEVPRPASADPTYVEEFGSSDTLDKIPLQEPLPLWPTHKWAVISANPGDTITALAMTDGATSRVFMCELLQFLQSANLAAALDLIRSRGDSAERQWAAQAAPDTVVNFRTSAKDDCAVVGATWTHNS